MAIPALAPVAVTAGLEATAAVVGRLAGSRLSQGPLVLLERDPYKQVGDNWSTRAGRRAHEALKERLRQKPGWGYEPKIPTANGLRKPDVGAPIRKPTERNPNRRYQMELKPNTPTGRLAAKRAARRYTKETDNRTRGIFYDPKDFM